MSFNMESAVNELAARIGNIVALDPTSDEFYATVDNRLKRIEEEVAEMRVGVDAKDPQEILDGIIDILVTAYGAKQVIAASGYQVESAEQAIAENNLTKVTLDQQLALDTAIGYTLKGEECYVRATSYNGKVWYSVIRKSDGKFMKLLGHVKPDLSKYLPLGAYHAPGVEQTLTFGDVNV